MRCSLGSACLVTTICTGIAVAQSPVARLCGRRCKLLHRAGGLWKPYPVEYKRTRDQHGSVAYRIQVCAQALCLEEMLQVPVPAGAVFDGKAKRREVVNFDEPLRQEVERFAARMHQILQSEKTPLAVYAKKCEGCSMKPICLPKAVESLSASRYLARAVEANLRQSPNDKAAQDEDHPR